MIDLQNWFLWILIRLFLFEILRKMTVQNYSNISVFWSISSGKVIRIAWECNFCWVREMFKGIVQLISSWFCSSGANLKCLFVDESDTTESLWVAVDWRKWKKTWRLADRVKHNASIINPEKIFFILMWSFRKQCSFPRLSKFHDQSKAHQKLNLQIRKLFQI